MTSVATPNQTSVYVTPDAGTTWTQVFTQANSNGTISDTQQTVLALATGPSGSVAVAVSAISTDPKVKSTLSGVFLSQDFGGSWHQLNPPKPPDIQKDVVTGGQTPVNLTLAIDPTNPNLVYLAGDVYSNCTATPCTVPAFRIQYNPGNNSSTIASLTFEGTPTSFADAKTVHADSRAMAFALGRLLFASDGGLYVRNNPQGDGIWQGLNNNLSGFEPFKIAFDANSKRLVIAAQDNGVVLQSRPGEPGYMPLLPADGVNAVINDKTFKGKSAIYTSIQNLDGLTRWIVDSAGDVNGVEINCIGPENSCAKQVGASNNFSSQFVLNRLDPTRIAMGGNGVYVTQDNSAADATRIDLTLVRVGDTKGSVTSIAYGAGDNASALIAGAVATNSAGNALVDESNRVRGTVWRSPSAAQDSLENLPDYTNKGGLISTGLVFDARTAQRFFVADSVNLWSTQNGAAPAAGSVTFQNRISELPRGFIRPTSVEFISNNGVNALLVGGLNTPLACDSSPNGCVISPQQSPITVADSDSNGNLMGWRAFGQGLPNALISTLSYNPTVDVLAAGAVGRGAFVLYDVTSNFPQAFALQFGLANNNSNPAASILTDGTALDGTHFVRPLAKYGTGTLTIAGDATYTGGTTILGGVLQLGVGGASGSILGNVAFCSDASNSLCDPSTSKTLVFNRSDAYAFNGAISGPGEVVQAGRGTTVLTAANTYTGGTTVLAGTLQLGIGGVSGSILGNVGFCSDSSNSLCDPSANKALVFNRSDTYAFDGAISGPGQVMQVGSGTTVLTAVNTYSGPTFVAGGTLRVNGSIASSVLVMAGAMLGGNGTVGPTTILPRGVLSPGNSVGTLTVNGNLVLSAASLYLLEVQGNTADRVNVSDAAALAGTVGVSYLGGNLAKSYTFVAAAAGRTGTFDALAPLNLPSFITASLAYTATDAQLNLTSGIGAIAGLTRNQSAVASALDNSFNSGAGSLPALFGVAASQLPAALDMLSGEGVSGTQETAFFASDMFTSIMMDQGAFWRNGETVDISGVTFAGEPLQYAPSKKPKMADHPVFKEMAPPPPYQPRWRAWLTGFDGTAKLDGEAGIGSATLSHNTGGLAGGLDYQFAPDLLAGFAIGGSSSNFSVRDRITSGHLEGAHFGGYGVKTWGPLYAAGTLAFSTFRNSETRSIVGIGPTETATGDFGSNLLSGRVEVGAKQAWRWFTVTPFAAVQFAELWQNGFSEANPVPAGAAGPLGLTFGSRNVSSLPTFLGAQFDTRFAFANGMVLSPYARLSWVHEFHPNRAIDASFIALPGAAFTVDGPRAASDAARIDAGAKLAISQNAWLFASFDGEFSDRSQSYAGKGGVRVAW